MSVAKKPVIHGFIPARGGSKGLPRKNILPFNGHPLIYYAAKALNGSEMVGEIVCSTEDEEIATIATGLGLGVHQRPAELARDESNVVDSIIHYASKLDNLPDLIVLVQPTNPFVTPEIISMVLKKVLDSNANSGHTITKLAHSQHYINQRTIDGNNVRYLFPGERAKHVGRHTKQTVYGGGNLWVVRTEALLKGQSLYAEPCIGETVQWSTMRI